MAKKRERATEAEWCKWFTQNADFGPAHSDVVGEMKREFMGETGKNLPLGWHYAEDGESTLDED